MCGIFGILSTPGEPRPASTEDYFGEISRLLAYRPGASGKAADFESALRILEAAKEQGYALTARAGFLAILEDSGVRKRLAETARAIRDWVKDLENRAAQGGFTLGQSEQLNGLIVGGHDLAWQAERDLLENVEPLERLLAGEELTRRVVGHGWHLNLILNNLNRLEVRGRDSAGLAVYAHFPSAEALEQFLSTSDPPDRFARAASDSLAASRPGSNRFATLEERGRLAAFSHMAVVRPDSSERTLLFAYKVAEEVGEMGSNVQFLREAISHDRLFQAALREREVEIQALAHTRWASNGIVSVPNCHPVDSTISKGGRPVVGTLGTVVGVLNGDVDNYQELFQRYIREAGFQIDEEITTDAKIIPLVVGHHLRRSGSLEEAFRAAFDEFEGSMAIGLMAADRPGEFLFGQKGSGQGLFIGFAGSTVAIASEMYGLVEITPRYLKAEGERIPGGEIFHLHADSDSVDVRIWDRRGGQEIPPKRIKQAEITTRDINRGEFPRFLLKEISESVQSVQKTLRGKFEMDDGQAPRFFLGAEVLDPERVAALSAGRIRRILAIGQGTAAIAASGVAYLLGRALAGARTPLQISSQKATELSAHGLRDDMSDTLIIAVSQSGTTADTNRTVDLVKDRGAWVIAIVNRRNSDLVYKAHGVLYTSDGRDIEMSVASTKAFYAQNVAGQVLSLALAEAMGTLSRERLAEEVKELRELPAALAATLAQGTRIGELAEKYALRRSYWAVVGTGPGKIAADEIRIKLSELCYKSIASDFLEDKKHIDLSAEPLVLVCANDISAANASDVVKEVAIFKAHRSVPLVVVEEGETRFDPYAAGVVPVPVYRGALNYLLSTMAGHLFGYHAAASFDARANQLRAIRTGIVKELNRRSTRPPADGESIEEAAGEFDPTTLPAELVEEIARVQNLLTEGVFDSGLRTGTAVSLANLFQFILGRLSLDLFAREFQRPASAQNLIGAMVSTLTTAINEMARPIDAIKHQAKTVTVGVSRLEEPRPEGVLWDVLRAFALPLDGLAQSHRTFLSAFEPLVAQVEGSTLYRVTGLDPVGRPRTGSMIQVEKKTGVAAQIYSRAEEERPLSGTKWGVVKTRELYLGYGQTDNRKILIMPLVGEKSEGYLLLYHLELLTGGDRAVRLRALSAHRPRLERLKIAVTERNLAWDPALIDCLDNEVLFLKPPEQASEEMLLKSTVDS